MPPTSKTLEFLFLLGSLMEEIKAIVGYGLDLFYEAHARSDSNNSTNVVASGTWVVQNAINSELTSSILDYSNKNWYEELTKANLVNNKDDDNNVVRLAEYSRVCSTATMQPWLPLTTHKMAV